MKVLAACWALGVAVLVGWTVVGQEPHVHGGFAACYEVEDWQAQEAAFRTRDRARWNEIVTPRLKSGECWLTEAGADYELRPSGVEGTVQIRRHVSRLRLQKQAERPWAYVSIDAVGEGG